jgi:transposase-like protein
MTIEELENATDVLNELTEHHENLKERERNRIGVKAIVNTYHARCPRCQARARVLSGHPYCPDCSWDSLENYNYIVAA